MVFLTTEQKILDKTPLDKNLLSHNLKPAIMLSQKINVTQLLGDQLINKIYSDIEADSLSGNYKYLVDTYLQDMVTYWSVYYALTDMLSKAGNRGLQIENSENSSGADLATYRELKSTYKNIAETFSERTKNYLWINNGLFIEFNLGAGADGKVPTNIDSKFFSGLQI